MLDAVRGIVSSDFSSAYINYPENRPFINSKWMRSTSVKSKAFPESNRDLIINALKSLQQKINSLNLNENGNNSDYPREANVYSAYPIQHLETNQEKLSDRIVNEYLLNRKKSEESSKTLSTEQRVLQLEKQLARMRSLLNEDKNYASTTTTNNSDENLRNSSKSESRNKLNSSKSRKLKLQNASTNTHHDFNNNALRASSNTRDKGTHTNNLRSKSVDISAGINSQPYLLKTPHYRLHLGDIPFVVGKSTAPSHHLGTNIQNVISLLKMHHPKICGKNCMVNTGSSENLTARSFVRPNSKNRLFKSIDCCEDANKSSSRTKLCNNKPKPQQTTTSSSSSNNMDPLKRDELLRVLQESYTKLVLHHYDLTKQILGCCDSNLRSELQLKADVLNKKMKSKAKQINKLKSMRFTSNNEDNLDEFVLNNPNENDNGSSNKKVTNGNTNNNNNTNSNNECQLKRLPSSATSSSIISNHPQTHSMTLKLFKDIKNLQSRLQSDE